MTDQHRPVPDLEFGFKMPEPSAQFPKRPRSAHSRLPMWFVILAVGLFLICLALGAFAANHIAEPTAARNSGADSRNVCMTTSACSRSRLARARL